MLAFSLIASYPVAYLEGKQGAGAPWKFSRFFKELNV